MTEVIEREATAPPIKSDMPTVSPQAPRLLDQVRDRIRVKHYSMSTEKTYIYWIRFFIRWSGMRHSDVSTTMIYTHVLNRGGHGVQSPLDRICT